MGMLDGLLGQISSQVDVQNLAGKLGLNPDQVTQAIGALAQAHQAPGDTATQAAQATGLSTDMIQQIIGQIGGEGALDRYAAMLGDQQGLLGKAAAMLDRDGDGNPLNDLTGMASGLFGKQ